MLSKYSTRYSLSDDLQLLVLYTGDADIETKYPLMKAIINAILRDKKIFPELFRAQTELILSSKFISLKTQLNFFQMTHFQSYL